MLAISSFLTAFLMLVVSTFAWFARSNEGLVDTVTFGVKNDTTFKIGLKVPSFVDHDEYGETGSIYYTSEVTQDLLVEFGLVNVNSKFVPVSTSHSNNWLSSSNANTSPILTSMPLISDVEGLNAAQAGFFQFDLYFKAYQDAYLYLAEGNISADVDANIITGSEIGIAPVYLNRIKYFMRTSFYSYSTSEGSKYKIYEPNVTQPSQTKFFGRLDVDGNGYFENDGTNEYVFGEVDNRSNIVYNESARSTTPAEYDNSFQALSESTAMAYDETASLANGMIGRIEDSSTIYTLQDTTNSANAIAFLPGNTDARVSISIYAEGWDKDCTDYVEQSKFLADYVFETQYAID